MFDFRRLLGIGTTALAMLVGPAAAQDQVSFGTNWLAQAEHGGFYQAVADGTYAAYGLDVTIRQGGPQAANRALLVGGQIEFYMGGPTGAIDAVAQGIPTLTIAAIFQKHPQVLLAHPEAGFESLADLAGASKYILSRDGYISFFAWMKSTFEGFEDAKFEPYTFNPAPFIVDPKAVQQGFVTSEPYEIERQAGFAPQVFLLADHGFEPYSTTIETMQPWYADNKDVARRFVEASIIGWYNYLYGDNTAANALIQADNPEMTDGQLAYGLAKMKEYGLLVSGDAAAGGIGCMTDERWNSFYDQMVAAGVFEAGIDVSRAYSTELVCHGLGVERAR